MNVSCHSEHADSDDNGFRMCFHIFHISHVLSMNLNMFMLTSNVFHYFAEHFGFVFTKFASCSEKIDHRSKQVHIQI